MVPSNQIEEIKMLINKSIIQSLLVSAEDSGEIWLDVNGSSKHFYVYCEDYSVITVEFRDIKIAIDTDTAEIVRISFDNPKSLNFDIADIMKNLCHANIQVVG